MKKLIFPAVIVTLTFTFTACGEAEQSSGGPTYNYEKADSLPTGYLEELGVVRTNIEITAKLFEHLESVGYAFDESLMQSAGKSYSGSTKQAMGIGASGSDLVYTSTFGQNQSAMNRMKGLIDISNALGIGEAFDASLMEQLSSEDSTINKSVILTKAYLKAKDQLFSEERAQLATFMVVGGWIEGVYIGSGMMKDEIKDKECQLGFWELCNSYENVNHMMSVFEGNPEMKKLADAMHEIGSAIGPIKKNAKKYKAEHVAELHKAIGTLRSNLM